MVRQGLKLILADRFKRAAFGEARNAQEAFARIAKEKWDVAVLDITMPGRSGLDLLVEFKNLRPDMPVLVLSVLSEDEVALRVLKSGAAGFVHKETSGEELVRAVRKVLAGGKYVSPALAEKLALRITAPQFDEPHKKLSDREYVVMKMLASGTTLTQIGKILSLSIKTISTYRARILTKLQLDNNAELTRYALHHKLVE